MALYVTIATKSTLVSLLVALVTSIVTGQNALSSARKLVAGLRLRFFNADGSMRMWDYCPIRACNELCRFLARVDVI